MRVYACACACAPLNGAGCSPPTEVVPKRGNQGLKDFEPDYNDADQQEKLGKSRDEWMQLASAPRVVASRTLSVGLFREDIERVELTVQKGSHFKSVGYFDKAEQKTMLYPEEALLLMDKGVIEVYYNGVPLTLQEGYVHLLPKGMSIAVLTVFLHLRRIGYIARWHARPIIAPQSLPTQQPTPDTPAAQDTPALGTPATPAARLHTPNTPLTPITPTTPATPATPASSTEEEASEYGGWFHTLGTQLVSSLHRTVSPFVQFVRSRVFAPSVPTLCPLLRRQDSKTFDDVYTRLREGVGRQLLMDMEVPPMPPRLSIDLDVYRPNFQFKKSAPGSPTFRICVCNYTEDPPNPTDLHHLLTESAPAELKLAAVDVGTVSFYEMHDVELAIYADYRRKPSRTRGGKRKREATVKAQAQAQGTVAAKTDAADHNDSASPESAEATGAATSMDTSVPVEPVTAAAAAETATTAPEELPVAKKPCTAASSAPRMRVLVLDCGGITNPDCELGNAAVAVAMGVSPEDAQRGECTV